MDEVKDENSSDDSMEAEDEEINLEQLKSLNEKLLASPYDYQSHVDKINLLRKMGEFDELSNARKEMQSKFPLTKNLWLDWLGDEQKYAEGGDHQKLQCLFELAVQDYMCPEIWLEYAQYSIMLMAEEDGIEKIRSIMEKGLSNCGLHASKGSAMWEAYRETENAILLTMQPAPGSILTPSQIDKINQQTSRVGQLFARQLAVPLLDMEDTMAEFMEWRKGNEDGEIPKTVATNYDKALKYLGQVKLLEADLDAADMPKYEVYVKYIEFEKKSNDPARIQCIFERAIADNCLNSQLWSDYLNYLDRTLKNGPIVMSSHQRAVRNCPWVSNLWQSYLISMERNNSLHEDVESALNEGMAVGFGASTDYAQLWQTYCDITRRKFCKTDAEDKDEATRMLRSCFEKATNHLTTVVLPGFGNTGDAHSTLWSYWAKCEANLMGNIAKSREIYDNLLNDDADARRSWEVWHQYFQLEIRFGDIEHAQAVLRHAVHTSAADDGSADAACSFLVRFEREEGDLEVLDEAQGRTEARLSKVNKRKEKAALQQATVKTMQKFSKQNAGNKMAKDGKFGNKKDRNKRPYSKDNDVKSNVPVKKAKIDSVQKEGFKEPGLPIRFVKPSPTKTPSKPEDKPSKPEGKPSKPTITPPPGYKGNKEKEDNGVESKVVERSKEGEEKTVFVSNVSYEVEDPENKLNKVFCECGEIVSIRLAKNYNGKFRGFAYVEFKQISSVEKALKLDRQLLEGRPLFISPNLDKSKPTTTDFKAFKYRTGMEKHKLFIAGLSFDTTEQKLREVFAEHGAIKSLRIVTARNGKSKGLAYVEYEQDSDAAQAIMKTDQTQIDEFTITVAISNPPPRKEKQLGKSLGGGNKEPVIGGRGRGRTQVSLMPRALQRSKVVAPSKDANDNNVKSMSNKDFAQLLKNK